MNIRKAMQGDAEAITDLLKQLDYALPVTAVREKIERFSHVENELLMVYVEDDRPLAFISIHFIPQIAVEGDFARISYFCVDEDHREKKIGDGIERYCVESATARGCDRIELHSHSRRTDAHRFYEQHGYSESPKYYVKYLNGK